MRQTRLSYPSTTRRTLTAASAAVRAACTSRTASRAGNPAIDSDWRLLRWHSHA